MAPARFWRRSPAQLLDESHRVAGDVPRELDGVDSFQYDVVGFHRICPSERRRS